MSIKGLWRSEPEQLELPFYEEPVEREPDHFMLPPGTRHENLLEWMWRLFKNRMAS